MRTSSAAAAILLAIAGSLALRVAVAADDPDGDSWPLAGRDWRQSYYSPLADINATNVGELGFAWGYDLEFTRTQEATPVVVDGVMYTSGNVGRVYALDAGDRRGAAGSSSRRRQARSTTKARAATTSTAASPCRHGKVFVGSARRLAVCARRERPARSCGKPTRSPTAAAPTRSPARRRSPATSDHRQRRRRVRRARLCHRLRRRDRQQAWRFFTVPGDPKKAFEHPELEDGVEDLGPEQPLGHRPAAAPCGTAWPTTRSSTCCTSARATARRGIRRIRSPGGGDNLFLA